MMADDVNVIEKEKEIFNKLCQSIESAYLKIVAGVQTMKVYDKWWLNEANTHLRLGIMSLACAINAKPPKDEPTPET